jgi:class 3 adenylate cyclase
MPSSDRPSHASTKDADFSEQMSEAQGMGVLGSSQNGMDENVLGWFQKRNGETLKGALAFVPRILQQSYFEGGLDQGQIVIHRGTGAVLFTGASGFTELTERLAAKSNGAELLSGSLTKFFTPLIDLINTYRGDVIKFSGDALTVYFLAVDDTKGPKYNFVVPPHGTYGLPDLGAPATAILRASACCIEIHKRLHMFDTGVDGVNLCLHLGVGFGQVNILQVGGVVPPETHVPRCEYLIAGPPLEQISVAEPLARDGQTCVSPQAWEYVKDCVIEGSPLEDRPDYHLLQRMDESKYTFPTIKHAARENDNRLTSRFRLTELNVIRRYIPSSVFKQIECGTLDYVNEMRNVSVIFVQCLGQDAMSDKGARQAQELMAEVQASCYAHEGTLNKFLIDDKGMLFLLVFGLPPLVHTDDPTRAVLACFDMLKVLKKLSLTGKFGVTTGRTYCGVCGSASRMEYTVLGDCVNLSARLMSRAPKMSIWTDEETKNKSTTEIVFNALTPISMKHRTVKTPIFLPVLKDPPTSIGLTKEKRIRFPWHDVAMSSDSSNEVTQLCSVRGWGGMSKASDLLGGGFDKDIHAKEQVITFGKSKSKPPEKTPFADGGTIVIEGPTGMGQLELAEHIITHAAVNFKCLPVFGTMGPRPGDSSRLAVELLRSCLGVCRHLDPQIHEDDGQALLQAVPQNLQSKVPALRSILVDEASKEKSHDILDITLDVVSAMVTNLLKEKETSVLMCLQFEYGTSLFPKTLQDQVIFWRVVDVLTKLVNAQADDNHPNSQQRKPFILLIVSRDADRTSSAVQAAERSHTLLTLSGLDEKGIVDYMSNILNIKEDFVPHPVRSFVQKVTLGNPMFVRETLQQLIEHQFVSVALGPNGQPKNIEYQRLEEVNLALWGSTRMVGDTRNLLEALDPLEAAVLKMSTCFSGPFTLPDLAASTCSRWAGATHFDLLRLFKALQTLVKRNIVELVTAQEGDEEMGDSFASNCQRFQCVNALIRDVGGSMVLEQQKKSVKRQALIDRTLNRELPSRMDVVQAKKSVHHIPWYYEQAFKRMM